MASQSHTISHPRPQLPVSLRNTRLFCTYCFQSIGEPHTASQRHTLEAQHICAERDLARQPAAPPPFN
jgi:hypothetical protein